ncbi:hypothetical protein [Saccharopolyspora shandongensis]|uniref:hypothetical protein n=1 Tax=Saccharopolyspora shandongensis TaxID=418495 RepID=UPI0033EDABB9
MALTIGELVGYLRLNDQGWQRGLSQARREVGEFFRDADGRLRDASGRFAAEGTAAGQGFAGGFGQGIGSFARIAVRVAQYAAAVNTSIATTTLRFGALTGAAGLATNAVSTLGSGLVAASGSLLLLPGVAAAGGVAMAALRVGIAGFGEALSNMDDPAKFAEAIAELSPAARTAAMAVAGLKPRFDELRALVQDRLFSGLGEQISALGTTYLPILDERFGRIADAANRAALSVGLMLTESTRVADVTTIGDSAASAFENLAGAIGPISAALLDVATVGAGFLPNLTAGAREAAVSLQQFVAHARETGQLQAWISGGLSALGEFAQILGNVGGILASVFSAVTASGTSALSLLVEATGAVRAFLGSTQGMQVLGQIFGALSAAAAGLVPVLAEIGGAIVSSIAPALTELGPMVGQALASLAPAIAPLGQALAALAPLIGLVAQHFAGLLATAVQAIAPIIVALVPVVSELANSFGSVLTGAIQAIAPALLSLAQGLAPVAAQFSALVAQVLPQLQPMLSQIASTIAGVLVTALQGLAPIIPPLATAFMQVVSALLPLVPLVGRIITELLPPLLGLINALVPIIVQWAGVQAQLITAIMPVVEVIVGVLIPVIQALLGVVTFVFERITPIITGALTVVQGIIQAVMAAISGDWSGAWQIIQNALANAWAGIKQRVQANIDAVLAFFRALHGRLWETLAGAGTWLIQTGRDLVNGLVSGLRQLGGQIVEVLMGFARQAWQKVKSFFGIASPSKLMMGAGINIGQGLALGIASQAGAVDRAFATMAAPPRLPAAVLPAPNLAPPIPASRIAAPSAVAYRPPAPPPGSEAVTAAGTPVVGGRAPVHIDQFNATPTQTPADIARELDWLSRGRG